MSGRDSVEHDNGQPFAKKKNQKSNYTIRQTDT